MKYISARNTQHAVNSLTALIDCIAPDGGLYLPASVPVIDYLTLRGLNYRELCFAVLGPYFDDIETSVLKSAIESAYNSNFPENVVELCKVNGSTFSLELWHGPTLAFKDIALTLMPYLLNAAKRITGDSSTTQIIVATSGDTGKAALEGFKNVENIKINVYYPHGGVSDVQRLQMVTQQGNNVAVYAIEGNFDDVQTAVKKLFADEKVKKELQQSNTKLSSANSINFGRLAPQIVYYFASYLELLERGEIEAGQQVNFCVPTGNFGDILAGYYAKLMGLPINKLICASNENNVLADFFATGVYNANRTFAKTTSPSMDILISSNLERLLYMATQNDALVRRLLTGLSQTGQYTVSEAQLTAISSSFAAAYATEPAVKNTINSIYKNYNYVVDTHTAVAFDVLAQYKNNTGDNSPCVVLSTASPYKFSSAVLAALDGAAVSEQEFENIAALCRFTGTAAPTAVTSLQTLPQRFTAVIKAQDIAQTLK